MKKKDIQALFEKTAEELKKIISEQEVEILKLKRDLLNKKLKNTSLLKTKSDDLARLKTVLTLRS